MTPTPHCVFCMANHGEHVPAAYTAAQSTDMGETIDWVLICKGHADGWNEGGDWQAPLYPLDLDLPKVIAAFRGKKNQMLDGRDRTPEDSQWNTRKHARFDGRASAYHDCAEIIEALLRDRPVVFEVP